MMLRKFTAIFFLSLASMMLLAFTVLPHHHHQEYICFATTHCADEINHTQHSHDGNSEHNHHACINNLLQTEISRTQHLEHACEMGNCHHFILIPFMVSEILVLLSREADETTNPNTLYREKLHAVCHISDLTGRAPPYKG